MHAENVKANGSSCKQMLSMLQLANHMRYDKKTTIPVLALTAARTLMLLTITTTYRPATDLGYLLHKHPERVQSFSLSFRRPHVFYPEASDQRCTLALLLDIDPVHLVRGRHGSDTLEQYVNDRPYVASSFLSVAIAEVFGTALNGRSAARQELAETPLPLQATLSVV